MTFFWTYLRSGGKDYPNCGLCRVRRWEWNVPPAGIRADTRKIWTDPRCSRHPLPPHSEKALDPGTLGVHKLRARQADDGTMNDANGTKCNKYIHIWLEPFEILRVDSALFPLPIQISSSAWASKSQDINMTEEIDFYGSQIPSCGKCCKMLYLQIECLIRIAIFQFTNLSNQPKRIHGTQVVVVAMLIHNIRFPISERRFGVKWLQIENAHLMWHWYCNYLLSLMEWVQIILS